VSKAGERQFYSLMGMTEFSPKNNRSKVALIEFSNQLDLSDSWGGIIKIYKIFLVMVFQLNLEMKLKILLKIILKNS